MLKVLIVADDFTGALDTGVQFSKLGIETLVTTLTNLNETVVNQDFEVLVIDTESRYLPFDQAYQKMKEIMLAAKKLKVPYIYKKVDSALRGNISAEIKAILDTNRAEIVPFLPAYPEMNRILVDGTLYIDEIPVSESVFAEDPYEPVVESNLILRLAKEAQIQSSLIKNRQLSENEKGLLIFDAQTESDLENQFTSLDKAGLLRISIGCAGFAKILSKRIFPDKQPVSYQLKKPVVVVSGSLNPITGKQIEYAENKGYPRLSLTAEQLLTFQYWESKQGQADIRYYLSLMKQSLVVFETLSDSTVTELKRLKENRNSGSSGYRVKIGEALGKLTEALWKKHATGTFLFTGGDTLFQAMKVLAVHQIQPITEISPGVVLSKIRWQDKEIQVLTKSGGFGPPELFEKIRQKALL